MSFSWADAIVDEELAELHAAFNKNIEKANQILADLSSVTTTLQDDIKSFHFDHPPTGDYDLHEFLKKVSPEKLGPPSMYPKPNYVFDDLNAIEGIATYRPCRFGKECIVFFNEYSI